MTRRPAKTYFVTGGCGFIGSNFIRYLLTGSAPPVVVNLDKLTYAGNRANLADLASHPHYHFVHGDICDRAEVNRIFTRHQPAYLINFAAESHVDRSIGKPDDFIRTDVFGAFTLLEAGREHGLERFIQISTDEVYGSIQDGSFREDATLTPSNPYSASKAGADRLAYSYFATYGLPVIITRASNNFGPYQYPEKLIPLFVTNALANQSLPLYGDGQNVRDWLYVDDHCRALQFLIEQGQVGEVYNIGAGNERTNRQVTRIILDHLGKPEELIRSVKDRLGHDRRYSLNCDKLHRLGWRPEQRFEAALHQTIDWYRDNESWWKPLKSGEFLEYYKAHYGD